MMKKMILLAAACVAASVGCKREVGTSEALSAEAIQVRVGIAPAAQGKAIQEQAAGLSSAQFLRVDAAAVLPTDFSGATVLEGAVTAATGDVVWAGAQADVPKYKLNNDNAYFVAYYPVQAPASGLVTWSIDGSTDILYTKSVWDAGTYQAPIPGTSGTQLVFDHALSRVEVACVAEDGSEIAVVRSAWGEIEKIEFLNAPTTMVYTLNGLAIAAGTAAADKALLASYAGTAFAAMVIPEYSATPTVNAVAMLAPVSAQADQSFALKITTKGDESGTPAVPIVKTVKVNLNQGGTNFQPMGAGFIHKVTLVFKANGKDIEILKTVITPWVAGSEGSHEMNK